MLKFIHKPLNLRFAYYWAGKLIPVLSAIFFFSLTIGLIDGLYLAPKDYQQGHTVRILYIHVPAAILSIAIYAFMGLNSLVYLIWHIKLAEILAKVAAPIGASFTLITLVTGAIWGKPMWGTWWIWDARLTSELILLFLYLGYIGLQDALQYKSLQAKACAILAIIGLIDLPIVHYSVKWWHTLHQGPSFKGFARPSIDNSMLTPLLWMLIAFSAYSVVVILISMRSEIIRREGHTKWMRAFLIGKQESNA